MYYVKWFALIIESVCFESFQLSFLSLPDSAGEGLPFVLQFEELSENAVAVGDGKARNEPGYVSKHTFTTH